MLQARKFSIVRHSSNEAYEQRSGIPMSQLDHASLSNVNEPAPPFNTKSSKQNNINNEPSKNSVTNVTSVGLSPNLISNLQATAAAAGVSPFDDVINNELNLEWIYKPWIQRIVRICAFASFLSICANTPETFKKYQSVLFVSYATDVIATLVLTIEMIAKFKIRGLFRGESAYIFDRWCQFDGIMVIFHIISVVLQVRDKKRERDQNRTKN